MTPVILLATGQRAKEVEAGGKMIIWVAQATRAAEAIEIEATTKGEVVAEDSSTEEAAGEIGVEEEAASLTKFLNALM
jgi:hypothetical protein